MNLHHKLIFPLLDENLELEDISKESGFSGIFESDINRFWLDNHIFLLYKRTMDPQSLKTRKKLFKSPNLSGLWKIKIKGVLYTLFCFTRTLEISFIMKSSFVTNKERKRICRFWLFTDTEITDFIFGDTYIGEKMKWSFVPLEDDFIESLT